MFCPNCGTKNPDGANNCMNCGVSLNNNFQSNAGYQTNPVNNAVEQKSKLVAGLFGIFLGGLGAHNFYLGFKKNAIIQVSVTGGSILLTIITCGLFGIIGIPAIAGMTIWGLIEGIMILAGSRNADANGTPLKD